MPWYIKDTIVGDYQQVCVLYGNYLQLTPCDKEYAEKAKSKDGALDVVALCDECPEDYYIVFEEK